MFKLFLTIFFSIVLANPAKQVDVVTMKAIYLERFTRFIEWPESMDNDLFRIQVIGDKNLAGTFEEVFKEVDVKGKPVLIFANDDTYNEDFNPHIVYVTEKNGIKKVCQKVMGEPVLIVSEVSDGAKRGAMINLLLKDNKLRFEINELAMYNSPLYVSYRLKKAALRIIDAKQ